MRVIIAGLKGSGKSTVIGKVLEKRPDIKILTVGDYFAKVFEKKGLKRDEGDTQIKSEDYIKLDMEVFKQIGKDVRKMKDVIVDTHLLLNKPNGFYPGLPEFKIKEIMPDTLVVLEYSPEAILKRRLKDLDKLGRQRSGAYDAEGIEEEQKAQRHYAFACSAATGCTVKIISRFDPEKYDFEHAEMNAEEILKLFE
ncbi:hypothetical protein A3K63_05340 [Candidatus Micrarchaeota archaeon RBG_16_49_10]|nr:MAG: hypothetical protein A3K63_05340 [Candidatus Micrarchaeota archaeon RBG_16_49_10]